ncbi:class I SAM-dependent methyltransferase [Echinicola vietnamensis]|uniref:Protein-L-isoaspartate carboxylmethyltransferase n=1 Tax=Echinicola vietnamensis (strain DSM 17526 / LMG 23754 / KMM 6221) TaxID=926556 RepID=L0FTW4_ECHVK|nr:class I SAM-dependent methyltransferase [Echinicola vietnamensis]AGA77349.1 protein-L-isoaspartate carboxylmethyltransferase [Echinicola vietnamensis DSM 17526]
MKKSFTEEELKAIATQLSHPKGEMGIDVAATMHESNLSMTEKAIELLHLEKGDRVLELGHGSAMHVGPLLAEADGLQYAGLEISQLMHEEAKKHNTTWIDEGKAAFYQYDGKKAPFESGSFDKIFTVNTIYFWSEPKKTTMELKRLLADEGSLVIAFAQKRFMENLPFTKYGFTFYDDENVIELMAAVGLVPLEQSDVTETVKSKAMEEVEREFTVMRFSR